MAYPGGFMKGFGSPEPDYNPSFGGGGGGGGSGSGGGYGGAGGATEGYYRNSYDGGYYQNQQSGQESFSSGGGPGSGPAGQKRTAKDLPMHSRLFVIYGKELKQEDLRQAFTPHGNLEDVYLTKGGGVAYVKFSKASEAATAIEELNGKLVTGCPVPVKVMVATQIGGNKEEITHDELVRLYIKTPPDYNQDEIKTHFSKFGPVEFVSIIRDKNSNKPKGVAFVKFFRFYEAARALEECDPAFKPVFASKPTKAGPPSNTPQPGQGSDYGGGPGFGGPNMGGGMNMASMWQSMASQFMNNSMGSQQQQQQPSNSLPTPPSIQTPPDATTCVRILCPKEVDERQLTLLCDLFPGFYRCDMISAGTANATFTSLQWAAYTKDKLNGFEYPPGSRLVTKFVPDGSSMGGGSTSNSYQMAMGDNGHGGGSGSDQPFYPCSVEVPAKAPLANAPPLDPITRRDYAGRVFIVCAPRALPPPILLDAFCRFGDLLAVYTLPGKNYGYAKYASAEAAEAARHSLHGAELSGVRLKVIEAEEGPQGESENKRPRTTMDKD